MNFRSPPPSREGGVSGSRGARGLRSDSAGSDDSGFGDDSLSQDEYVQLRLQKMNTLMGFGGEPGINELDVVDGNGISASSSLHTGVGAYDSALLTEQKGPPPPPYSGDKKPLTAYERLQALSLKEGNPSTLQLVDEASSLPAPGGERYFGAATPSQLPVPQFDFDYGNNRTFMADEEEEDDDEDDAYVITWEGGQLGLLFKANPAGQVVIRRVNKKGTAIGLQSARAGDVLVGLNGITVQGVPFLEIIEQLKNPRFPIKLEFEPLKFGALPPGIIESSGVLPSYASYNGIPRGVRGSRDAPISPTSSSGTVELTEQESSFVHVSKPAEDLHEDRLRKNSEYDVVWDEGPLGCGLKNRSGYPTVKTASSIGVSASVAQIGEGDILIIINGYKTLDIGFKSAITMLQRAPKPIYLRFRRQPTQASSADAAGNARGATKESPRDLLSGVQLSPLQYAVLWSDGPLGIQIKSGNKGLVFVSRLTGAGNPVMTERITPGDIFVRIADVDVASRGIAGAFELLKSVQKPVVLVFQKVSKHDDDASTPIPSFRRMREEAAAGSSSSAAAHPRGLTRANSAGVRGSSSNHHSQNECEEAPWQTRTMPNRPSAIDETIRMQKPITARSLSCDLDYEDESDPGSQRSNARTDYSSVSQQVNVPHDHPPVDSNLGDSLPPRFSDIEAGRVITAEVTALPPPPSYLDVFTQSGRSRDFGEAFHAPLPGSPRSEVQSVSSSHLGDQQQSAFPPPPPPPAHEIDSFAALPPPPQYSSFFPADGGGNGGSRLQELRQQYIESERRRNQTQFGSTFMSSYSDLDDSDVMRQRKSSIPRAPLNPLPLSQPELWVRWSEGPLGITFKRKNGQIVVSRLTGAGFSPGLEQLRTGDWLVSFNDNSTENLKLSETMEMLKRLPKPIDMRFVVQ